jgi:hypothetical protein
MPRVINKYGCFTEEEVLTGWVVDQSGRHTRKRMDLRQQVGHSRELPATQVSSARFSPPAALH